MARKAFFKLQLSDKTQLFDQSIWQSVLKAHGLLLKFPRGSSLWLSSATVLVLGREERAYMGIFALTPFVMAWFSILYSLPVQASMNFSVLSLPDISVTSDTVVSPSTLSLVSITFYISDYSPTSLAYSLDSLMISPISAHSSNVHVPQDPLLISYTLLIQFHLKYIPKHILKYIFQVKSLLSPISNLLLNFSSWTYHRHLNFSFLTPNSWSPDPPIPLLQTSFLFCVLSLWNNTVTHPLAQVRYLVNILDSLFLSQLISSQSPNPIS